MTITLDRIAQDGGEALLFEVLNRLSMARTLRDDESALLEKLVRQSQVREASVYHRWTKQEDRDLLRLQHRKRGVANYAVKIGVSEYAAWMRLNRLRKRLRCGGRDSDVGG